MLVSMAVFTKKNEEINTITFLFFATKNRDLRIYLKHSFLMIYPST